MRSATAPAPSPGSSTPSWPEAGAPGTLALYVHWPFCKSKCPYCDFNSHVRETVDHGRWAAALETEIARVAAQAPGRVLTSIFFGGGTPSLMAPASVERVVRAAARAWRFAPDIEITLEANPTSVEAGKLAAFRTAGVNRASLGVQALDDDALRFLGRSHSARDALAAVATARSIFPRISFDLIYGRPGQTVADWRRDLVRALDHTPDHISVYQLTIEQGTAFHAAVRRGDWSLPDDELQADFWEAAQGILDDAGLPAYEVSNHSRPGAEARHNLTYWRYGDYAGIGPGAHGRLSLGDGRRLATAGWRKPESWLDAAEAGDGTQTTQILDAATQGIEAVMMGLRLREGVPFSRLERLGADPARLFRPGAAALLTAQGFLKPDPERLVATRRGLAVLDGVLGKLLA